MIFTNREDALDMVGAIGSVEPVAPSAYIENILDNYVAIKDPETGEVKGYDVDMALYFIFTYKAEMIASGQVPTSFSSEGSSVTRSAPDAKFFLDRAKFYRDRAMGKTEGGGLYIAAEMDYSDGGMVWYTGGHVQKYDEYYGWAYPWWSFAYGNVPDDWDPSTGGWIVGGDPRADRWRPGFYA